MQLISIKELRRQKIPRSTLQMRDVIKKKKKMYLHSNGITSLGNKDFCHWLKDNLFQGHFFSSRRILLIT